MNGTMQRVVINAIGMEKRTALMENEKLIECAVYRPIKSPSTGNIYKGKVQKVLPGMQAVFVDIGTSKNGFLHKDDLPAYQQLPGEEQKKVSISNLIKEGESILVQVVKEETGDKGAKLTALISFTGHLLVYFPFTPHIGISKKIKESHRAKLQDWGDSVMNSNEGLIIRTGCEEFPEEEMNQELESLRRQLNEVQKKFDAKKAPALIVRPYFFYPLLERWLNPHVEEILVDDYNTYHQVKEYAASFQNTFSVTLYNEKEPLFRKLGIETDIEKTLSPLVWLKNGSSLYFNVTEALTVIDVNTGKYTGKKDRLKTVVETNKIAAKEIMKQLRLRNIAGMIVIDFITMQSNEDKEQVHKIMRDALKKDSATMILHGFTKMGLFEMTRKKERPSLLETLAIRFDRHMMDGYILRPETFYYEMDRIMKEYTYEDDEALWMEVPQHFSEWLKKNPEKLKHLEKQHEISVIVSIGSSNREMAVRHSGKIDEIRSRMLKDSH
ncbi:Rne/Rng family ribonuclease [Fictibacillus norfolkensis]|uniref:Rne/Rng family ribonuclease n=1 Tax=Fictibacillus norfolkensis TaxID=2762233 RepID=A0ABR8SG60_9BACL|nr:Rne/Rng family ribonuclease [Fictibacillus norfolkensis]MBD7962482.1 Rne/Rng family ribonuclease [Fictibacillus norfolkensis]